MTTLLRILGVELMVRLGRRLPAPATRLLSALVLVAANLLPVWAVVEGRLGMGDVLLVYWFEVVVVGFMTTVRLLTVRVPGGPRARSWVTGDRGVASAFAVRYGVLTLLHGGISLALALQAGLRGTVLDWVAMVAAIGLSHVLALGLHWFGRGERSVVGPRRLMTACGVHMVAVHLTVLAGVLLLGGPGALAPGVIGAVVVVMAAKTVLDLCFHVFEHLALGRGAASSKAGPGRQAASA